MEVCRRTSAARRAHRNSRTKDRTSRPRGENAVARRQDGIATNGRNAGKSEARGGAFLRNSVAHVLIAGFQLRASLRKRVDYDYFADVSSPFQNGEQAIRRGNGELSICSVFCLVEKNLVETRADDWETFAAARGLGAFLLKREGRHAAPKTTAHWASKRPSACVVVVRALPAPGERRKLGSVSCHLAK